MDIETPVDIMHEQLPQIRRVTKLDEIPRVIPQRTPRTVLPVVKKVITPQRPKSLLRYYLIGLIIFAIIGLELVIIYRYDILYRHFYSISVSLKDELASLQHKLQHTNKIKSKLSASRMELINNYLKIGSQYRILQFRMDNYKEGFKLLSMAKSTKIDILAGDLRVAYVRIGATDAQNELLIKKVAERDESISELTSQLIKNISDQETLINENLRLKKESEHLLNELQTVKGNTGVVPLEDENANK